MITFLRIMFIRISLSERLMHKISEQVLQAVMPEEDPLALWYCSGLRHCQLDNILEVGFSCGEIVWVDVAFLEVSEPSLNGTSCLKNELKVIRVE